MDFLPVVVILGVLALVVLGLLGDRSRLTSREDDIIHIHAGEQSRLSGQEVPAVKVAQLDRLGKRLAAVVVIGAIILAGAYIYVNLIKDTGVRMG